MTHLLEQRLLQFVRLYESLFQHHKGGDHFPAQLVGTADYARFRNCGMAQQRGLDFDGSNAMAGDLDDLVCTAGKPHIAIFVDLSRVSRIIDARDHIPVVTAISLRLTPERRR